MSNEHARILREVDVAIAVDAAGFKYDWAPLTMVMEQKHVLRSIETFGKHVLPRFDTDPVHRTTRLREAALAQAA